MVTSFVNSVVFVVVVSLVATIICSRLENGEKCEVVSRPCPATEARGGAAAARASEVQPASCTVFVRQPVPFVCLLELVSAVNMSLNLAPVNTFDSEVGDEASSSAGTKWDRWIERFEVYMLALNISEDTQKRAILLHSLGRDTFEKFQTLPETGTTYKQAKDKLSDYFRPKINTEYEKAVFRRLRQSKGETIDVYVTRLRSYAKSCDFANTNSEIKSHLIQTTTDSKLRKKGLMGTMTLDEVISEGRNNELCRAQTRDMERELHVSAVSEPAECVHPVESESGPVVQATETAVSQRCYGCGRRYPHQGGRTQCPAWGKTCRGCGKLNHFAKHCRSKQNENKDENTRGHNNSSGSSQNKKQNNNHNRGPGRREDQARAQAVQDEDDSDDGYLFAIDVDGIGYGSNVADQYNDTSHMTHKVENTGDFDNVLSQNVESVHTRSHDENKSLKSDDIISNNEHDKSQGASSTNRTSMIFDICITWIMWMFALSFSMSIGMGGTDMPCFGAALVLFVIVTSYCVVKSAKYEFSVKMVSFFRCVLCRRDRKLFTTVSKWVIFLSILSVIAHMLAVTNLKDDGDQTVCIIESDGVINKPPKFSVTLNKSCEIIFTADSGASCSIIDANVYRDVLKDKITLQTTDKKIRPYGDNGRIEPLGKFTCTIESNGRFTEETFFVVPGKCGCLLSVRASQALGLITIAKHTINNVSDELVDQNPRLFQGIGAHNKYIVKLHIDESVPPVAQGHRRIPFHMRNKVETEIYRLRDLDIIERADGPTPWVSPIVVAPKPKNPNEVKLCVDMRLANRAIRRERHPQPTIDDIQNRLNGSTVYSKLDLKSGYHQLVLDEKSRYITTFSTHIGLWRYKRLNFGISSASEVFQSVIEHVIDGAMNISDDIIVFGKNVFDHDKALKMVFERLKKYGLTLNKPKCEFNKQKIDYFGMMFSERGMEPSPDKVKAVVNMGVPKTKEEVQSLLGMLNYSSRFIPNYSTVAEPLRRLTHKGQDFVWNDEQQKAFDSLKQSLSNKPAVRYFDVNKQTELVVDASPVGLGAILIQRDSSRSNVIAYGSRSLTQTEQRYSQIEREALAIVWACEHFHLYLFDEPVTIFTDNKPLVTLLGNPKSKLPMRLERWMMRLQQYKPVIKYQPGATNPADYISRHPSSPAAATSEEEMIAEEYVNFIADETIPKALRREEVLEATLEDATLTAVKELQITNRWYRVDHPSAFDLDVDIGALISFRKISRELSITSDGLILKKNKLVIPASLQQRTLRLAHEGHQGLNKTKALLREKVWFPGIDAMTSDLLGQCIACQANYNSKQREPLQMTELPNRPWQNVCVDFYGPLPSQQFLLGIMDEYSRFPEVEIVRSEAAATVVPVLDKLFSSRGIPEKLKTDNGPPFNGFEFEQFADYLGFEHQKVTPRWPEANGCAESFMKTLGKVCKCAQLEHRSWKQELYKFLRNYRATPHTTTGVAPATMLNGYALRTKLPEVHFPREDSAVRNRDAEEKRKMKMYAERRRNIKQSTLSEGDRVLMKNDIKYGKLQPKFQEEPFEVIGRKGSMIIAQRGPEIKARNSSHFKRIKTNEEPLEAEESEDFPGIPELPEPEAIYDSEHMSPPQLAPESADISVEKPQPENKNQAQPEAKQWSDQTNNRPQRIRKPPDYLKDYVTK